MHKFRKGDAVKVEAVVFTDLGPPHAIKVAHRNSEVIHAPGNSSRHKCLVRLKYEVPMQGIVVGYSYRATGFYSPGYYDGFESESRYLTEDKRHTVIMVQPTYTQRWLKPIACLETDLVESKE